MSIKFLVLGGRGYLGLGGGGIRVKQVRFGKLAFLQQNGALFGPKKCDFRPFRATFSMKNVWSVLFRKRSIGTFGSVGYFLRFQHKN